MGERKKKLEETARVLRSRLMQLERQRVSEIDRPAHEVGLVAVRSALTSVGQQLVRLAG